MKHLLYAAMNDYASKRYLRRPRLRLLIYRLLWWIGNRGADVERWADERIRKV